MTTDTSGHEMAFAQAEAMIERQEKEIARLRDENESLRAERDEWADKWKSVRRELAALKYPGGTGVVHAMQAEPAPEEPRVMAHFSDGRPMMTYHRAAMQKGE